MLDPEQVEADMRRILALLKPSVPRTVPMTTSGPSMTANLYDSIAAATDLTRKRVMIAVHLLDKGHPQKGPYAIARYVEAGRPESGLLGLCLPADEALMAKKLRPRGGTVPPHDNHKATMEETINQLGVAVGILVTHSTDGWGHAAAMGTLKAHAGDDLPIGRVETLYRILRGLLTEDGVRVLELRSEIPPDRHYRITSPGQITPEMVKPAKFGAGRFHSGTSIPRF